MGNACASMTPEQKEMAKQNKEIDNLMQKHAKVLKDEIKLLLLGPGESGKSTIFKQMKILQVGGGYSEAELTAYRFIVFGNCITQMKVIVSAVETMNVEYGSDEAKEAAARINALPAGGDAWTPNVGKDIKLLWGDAGIQKAYGERNKLYQLNDSAAYFFGEVDRLIPENYIPNEQDVLRARVRSTGIEEAEFEFDDMSFCMLDVGGQRSERRKWIHCFDSVTAVLFCAAMADYDQVLREDATQNRMKESLQLFDEICNSPWFAETAFILFLNKKDLFEEKIKTEDGAAGLKEIFPDYSGAKDYKEGATFIENMFKEKNTSNRVIYTHQTCAIDTRNVEIVFSAVRETLLNEVLEELF